MANKDAILDNVDSYSAEQLVEFIKNGVVTFHELVSETEGEFSSTKRKEVERLLASGDDDAWNKARTAGTVEALRNYLETYPDGKYREQARILKAQLESGQEKIVTPAPVDEEAWANVDKNSTNELSQFVREYPDSIYVAEANKRINDLVLGQIMVKSSSDLIKEIKDIQTDKTIITREARDNATVEVVKKYVSTGVITKNEFLDKLAEDHNLLSAAVVKLLIDEGIISLIDLQNIGIDNQFLRKMWEGATPDNYTDEKELNGIQRQSTEIYFWGIPSSGKSCALGAILSVAASGRVARVMDPYPESQGYGYMDFLKSHFPIMPGETGMRTGVLLGSTPINAFYEMGFDLTDRDNRIHPVTCIDMAGELMTCLYKSNAGIALEDTQTDMLETMRKILIENRTINRKMHIFVIEYGAEDRLYNGYAQDVYLKGAVSYIKNTNIFHKDTDAIYIMITKADKMGRPTKEALFEYINKHYLGFYNALEQICKENEINGKKVETIAFSLGDVCFQDYCKFNPRAAENVVEIILKRTGSRKAGKSGKILKSLRG